jgi:ERCC4-type nuclease
MVDSNEKSSRRAEDLKNATEKHPDKFTWEGFKELPVDIRFQDTSSGRYFSVELKEPQDMVASVLSGHLAQQLVVLKASREPGFIVCTGSQKSVLNSVTPIADGKYRGKDKIFRDFSRIKHFCATAYSEGYPVFFWDLDWAPTTLAHALDYFMSPTIFEYLHKDKDNPVNVAMLCMIPGVGATTAQVLVDTYGSIRALTMADPKVLAELKINGRKLGKRAEAVIEALT